MHTTVGEQAQEVCGQGHKVIQKDNKEQISSRRFPTFKAVDPNGKCKANGINKEKRSSWEISEYDTWALNAAYGGPLPPCQRPDKVTGGGRQEGSSVPGGGRQV